MGRIAITDMAAFEYNLRLITYTSCIIIGLLFPSQISSKKWILAIISIAFITNNMMFSKVFLFHVDVYWSIKISCRYPQKYQCSHVKINIV